MRERSAFIAGIAPDVAVPADQALDEALAKLPIPKVMRWGDSDVTFVRPVHKLVMLHGAEVAFLTPMSGG